MAVPFFIPTSSEWELLLLYILTSIWSIKVLDFGFSDRCVVVPHCHSSLHFPDGLWCGASFYVLICHQYILFSNSVLFYKVIALLLLTSSSSLIRLESRSWSMDDAHKCAWDEQTQDQEHHWSLDMADPGSVPLLQLTPWCQWHKSHPCSTSTQLTASVSSIYEGFDTQRLALTV